MANKVVSSRNGFHFLGVFCKVKALLSEEGALMATKQLKKRALHNKTRPSSQVGQGVSCHRETCELNSVHFLMKMPPNFSVLKIGNVGQTVTEICFFLVVSVRWQTSRGHKK